MKINSTETVRTHYVVDGGVDYKVVHRTWDKYPDSGTAAYWTTYQNPHRDESGEWRVLGSRGIHRYARDLDPEKPTYKRVVAAVKALTLASGAPLLTEEKVQ
jgi:hypothetical protein